MKIKFFTFTLFFLLFNSAFADTIAEGAEQYDWQTCLNAKTQHCLNSCTNSEDKDCSDNCEDLAKDKCTSEGLSPPQ